MAKYIVLTTPTFEAEFKKLKRKYPNIVDDFEALLNEIENDENLGDNIKNVLSNGNKVFKKRMKNSSANKGFSGGFRVIEYLITQTNEVYLLDIYSKSDQTDITNKKIRKLIRKNCSHNLDKKI